MDSSLYLLVGFPGTGKYTVAKALAAELTARGSVTRVVDNHYINNPIFGVIHTDGETTLPDKIWSLVSEVRSAVLSAIEEHSPKTWSFIFTNFITAEEAKEKDVERYLDRLAQIAEAREARLIVVTLTCETDELCQRIIRADRRERLKATSAAWVREQATKHTLYAPASGNAMTLDITHLPAYQAALRILEYQWAGRTPPPRSLASG